ncbi:MAG: O-antigen ligase C-terminal domain-containing protein [Burkholderiales bacterium]|nr:O-antigen ligase C-terminal domain-containing protein [Burkholderiales bacterium]
MNIRSSWAKPASALDGLGAVLLTGALLLPVGDAPWFSFWREWAAAGAVLLIVLATIHRLREQALPLRIDLISLPALAVVLAAVAWAQLAFGLLAYRSDALVPSLYLVAFAACVSCARSLPARDRDALADRMAAALLAAALLSAPLAVLQWLGRATLDLGIPVHDGRPVAHMEQANLLCSLLVQGALGAWRLAERRRLPRPLACFSVAVLLSVAVLTQSRVVWLVAGLLALIAVARSDLTQGLRRGAGRVMLLVGMAVVAGTLLMPALDHRVGTSGLSLADRMSGGRRPAVWVLFAQAIARRPWAGWGALQNGAAQYAQALQHPSLGWYFSSAHNLALDLMLWFGVPLGLTATVALVLAVGRRLARAPTLAALATALAAAALLLHAMVEFPLQYTYFLLPLALCLGASDSAAGPGPGGRDATGLRSLCLRLQGRFALPALATAPALALALLAHDYIGLSDDRPVVDVDRATRHGVLVAGPVLPQAIALDELRAFHAFVALPLRPGLSAWDLERARAAMLRQPYAVSIERYALLEGLGGHAEAAAQTIAHACRFEPPEGCAESQRAWVLWQQRWPQLPPWPATALP